MRPALVPQIAVRYRPELVVDEGHECLQGVLVARAPFDKQFGDALRRHIHDRSASHPRGIRWKIDRRPGQVKRQKIIEPIRPGVSATRGTSMLRASAAWAAYEKGKSCSIDASHGSPFRSRPVPFCSP